MTADLAPIALAAYRSRIARAARRRDAGEWSQDQAEADVRPWARMALRLGADMPELRPLLDGIFVIAGPQLEESERRWIVAEDLCPHEAVLAALTPARDAAFARAAKTGRDDPKWPGHQAAARDLQALADHFGCRPYGWLPPLEQAA